MLTRIISLTCTLAVSALSAFCQYQEHLPQAKPIPPGAAAMFKVLERPLGNFTGTVPISIPLISVRSGSLSADLVLNYNSTGGLKVEELPGNSGLGFSLSDGGGRITQMVRDKPDDAPYVGRLTNSVKPSNFNSSNRTHLYLHHEKQLDLEPDIFMYSIPGHSGKFFFKENGDVVMMTNDNVTVMYGGNYTPFAIFDEKGNRYQFGNMLENYSEYSGGGGSSPAEISSKSYSLEYMEDRNRKNRISFIYEDVGSAFTTITGSFMPLSLANTWDCTGFNTMGDVGTVTTEGGEYAVSRIDANSGFLLLGYESDYIYGPARVASISAYDSNGVFYKGFNLRYEGSFSGSRAKLTSIAESGSFFPASGDSIVHRFEYNDNVNLPEVLSPSVDIWGFYNGKSNYASGLIPNINISNGWGDFAWNQYADRTADAYYAEANILKKIIYPTGGYREFIYEGNKTLGSGDFFWYHPDPDHSVIQSFNETSYTYNGPSWPSMQHLFTVNTSYGITNFSYDLGVGWACGLDYTVRIMSLYDPGDLYDGTQVYAFYGQSSGSVPLKNGYYRIDVIVGSSAACTMGPLTGTWNEGTYDNTTISDIYGTVGTYSRRIYDGGGVRIKEIRDYDPLTNIINKTEYRYKMYSVDSTLACGLLVSPVNITATENNFTCGCQYIKIFPGSNYPLAAEGGSFVVYPEVRTIDSAKGWTDHLYTYASDGAPSGFPQEPPGDMSYYRGKPALVRVYDKNGTLLKSTRNEYVWNIPPSAPGIRIKPYWYVNGSWSEFRPYPGGPNDDIAAMSDVTYFGVSQPVIAPFKTIDTLFSAAGAPQITVTDYQHYEYANTYFTKKKSVTVNAVQRKEQTYKYAFTPNGEFSLGLSINEQNAKLSLADYYRLPLEVVDSLQASGGGLSFLQGAKYGFGYYGWDLHLASYRAYTSASDFSEINFSGYDDRGNLTEQYKTGDAREVYLWGYHGLYPVAKVTGSDYATVAGFVDFSVLNNPPSDAAMRAELDNIRTGLSGTQAQVTTYTYSRPHGMTSMTDAAGITVYYEYDLFGRLRLVRDKDNNILRKYDHKLDNAL